ncbi:MAG: LysM peptidoglycan-binding domain-containing protein, partial [Chitinophagaceae bacterium]|nr:LysM peptidoglycan-binding domain-containing protein [Chitinophagaceae bacterium]
IQFDYPKGKFKANQLLAIYARAGSSYLELATTYNIALYKLYGYNDLEETDLVSKDQILYLVPKRKEVSKKVHLVAAGENLYDISQNEGIQLNYLQAYNAGVTDKILVAGTTLILFKTNEAPKISTSPIKNSSIPNFLKRKKNN